MQRAIKKVTIIGVGLIGGSLGMALRRTRFAEEVVGVDQNDDIICEAIRLKAIDSGTTDIRVGVADADLVIFSTPIMVIYNLLPKIAHCFKPGAILTDVSSTKVEVVDFMEKNLPEGICFVGGHPMAGSEKTSVKAADPYLFENAIYILTPTEISGDFSPISAMVRAIGAKPLILTAREHDRIVACVSHLPHLVASALVGVAIGENQRNDTTLSLAAGGFRDTTRIAGSDPSLWRDIFISNKGELLLMLEAFQCELDKFKTLLELEASTEIEELLEKIRYARELIPSKTKGFFTPIFDVVVMVQDRPGSISSVTALLAEASLNIKDIEILHLREGEGGTLRLGFATEEEAETAVKILTAHFISAIRRT